MTRCQLQLHFLTIHQSCYRTVGSVVSKGLGSWDNTLKKKDEDIRYMFLIFK